MPGLHSPEKLQERKQRAIDRGFLKLKKAYTTLVVPDSVAPAVKAAAKSLTIHVEHDSLTRCTHHHGRLASLAALKQGLISSTQAKTAASVHRHANRLKHDISTKCSMAPDVPQRLSALPLSAPPAWADQADDDADEVGFETIPQNDPQPCVVNVTVHEPHPAPHSDAQPCVVNDASHDSGTQPCVVNNYATRQVDAPQNDRRVLQLEELLEPPSSMAGCKDTSSRRTKENETEVAFQHAQLHLDNILLSEQCAALEKKLATLEETVRIMEDKIVWSQTCVQEHANESFKAFAEHAKSLTDNVTDTCIGKMQKLVIDYDKIMQKQFNDLSSKIRYAAAPGLDLNDSPNSESCNEYDGRQQANRLLTEVSHRSRDTDAKLPSSDYYEKLTEAMSAQGFDIALHDALIGLCDSNLPMSELLDSITPKPQSFGPPPPTRLPCSSINMHASFKHECETNLEHCPFWAFPPSSHRDNVCLSDAELARSEFEYDSMSESSAVSSTAHIQWEK